MEVAVAALHLHQRAQRAARAHEHAETLRSAAGGGGSAVDELRRAGGEEGDGGAGDDGRRRPRRDGAQQRRQQEGVGRERGPSQQCEAEDGDGGRHRRRRRVEKAKFAARGSALQRLGEGGGAEDGGPPRGASGLDEQRRTPRVHRKQ